MRSQVEVGAPLVEAFSHLTGDRSSVHVDPEFARKTRFRGTIVHGFLPILLLLGRVSLSESKRIIAFSCRFTGAVTVGERLELRAESQVECRDETWNFEISRLNDGAKVTSGSFVLAAGTWDEPDSGPSDTLLCGSITENRWSMNDLRLGHAEEVTFIAEPAVARALMEISGRQIDEREWAVADDPNVMALVMASTLIGMRLPGRYATFLDLDATFSGSVDRAVPVKLCGNTAEIAPTGSRMRLNLAWQQGAHTIGQGTASSMIGAADAAPASYAEIKRKHAGLGLEGRTVLVTGASRGIGEASAKILAMHGARVAVHFFRGRADAEAIVADINANGGEAVALQADLAQDNAAATLIGAVSEALGPVDILINNAVGEFTPKPFGEVQRADFLSELGISLFGLHACCQEVLGHMRRQRWGKIINLGTIATHIPVAAQARYISIKSAVVGHTRSLAVETADDNIQVNMVVPAMTDTSLIAGLPRSLVARMADESPGGALLQPIDVAKTILFLASDWAGAISGQQIALTRGAPPFL